MQDALDIALKMALFIPLADIMAYRKVARAYFALLDVLCHNHAQARPHPIPLQHLTINLTLKLAVLVRVLSRAEQVLTMVM